MDPNLIDNMEVEDFLSRIPSDPELEMLKEPSRHQKRSQKGEKLRTVLWEITHES